MRQKFIPQLFDAFLGIRCNICTKRSSGILFRLELLVGLFPFPWKGGGFCFIQVRLFLLDVVKYFLECKVAVSLTLIVIAVIEYGFMRKNFGICNSICASVMGRWVRVAKQLAVKV